LSHPSAGFDDPSDDQLLDLLRAARTVAVVGLSPRPHRDSHRVASYLVGQGYRVFGVRPGYSEILGRPCFPSLLELPQPVDIVNVFRRPAFVPGHAEEAWRVGASVLWLQLGVVHPEAARQAEARGLRVVMDRCIMVEHQRLVEGSR
jgi:hypothetical protein